MHCEFNFGPCRVILTVSGETLTTDKQHIIKGSVINMTSSSEEMSNNATQYSAQQSKFQFKQGCSFAGLLNIKPGHKVLDMGCGTGELTRFLAQLVGEDGEVVGVDPDEERIGVAEENLADLPNVAVQVGDSVSGFPHANEAYYDLHFSSHVFHWLSLDERPEYVKKAFESLKPQGFLAIQGLPRLDDEIDRRMLESYNSRSSNTGPKITYVEEPDMKALLARFNFSDVETKLVNECSYFDSFADFAAWWLATAHTDINETPDKQALEDFKKKIILPDGRVKMTFKIIQIKARKDFALE